MKLGTYWSALYLEMGALQGLEMLIQKKKADFIACSRILFYTHTFIYFLGGGVEGNSNS